MNTNIEKFEEYGYVLIKNLINKDDLIQIKKYTESVFPKYESGLKYKELLRSNDMYQGLGLFFDEKNKVRYDGIPLEHRLYRGEGSPDLKDTPNIYYGKRASQNISNIPSSLDKNIFSSSLIDTIKKLLKATELTFLECSANRVYPKYPGEEKIMHIDTYGFTYGNMKILKPEEYFINSIIYLDGCDKERSPTKILPGTHNNYSEFNKIIAKSLGKTTDKNNIHQREIFDELIPEKYLPVVNIEAEPGDVLLFHSGLVHGISGNSSNECRNVVIANFCRTNGISFGKTRRRKEFIKLKERFLRLGLQVNNSTYLDLLKNNGRHIVKKQIKKLTRILKSFLSATKGIFIVRNSKAIRLLDDMPYLNLGSGKNWSDPLTVGLDINGDFEDIGYDTTTICDVEFDLGSFEPLPFSSDRFQGVYTSHCMEHLREKSVMHILKECRRVMKEGGILRIVLPDLSMYFQKYNEKDLGFFSWIKSKNVYRHDSWLRLICREFCGNIVDNYDNDELYSMYKDLGQDKFIEFLSNKADGCKDLNRNIPGVHKSYWDADKLIRILKEIGFSEVSVCDRFESKIEHFGNKKNHQFNSTRPEISFYVEAIK